jgi:hypothetical protein
MHSAGLYLKDTYIAKSCTKVQLISDLVQGKLELVVKPTV